MESYQPAQTLIGPLGKFWFKRSSLEWEVTSGDADIDFQEPEQTIARVPALYNFAQFGPVTEMVNLGSLATRLNRPVSWDTKNLRCPEAPEADPLIRRAYRDGWDLV